jgi:hypothetical protein
VKESNCPSWALGFATRLLAYDEVEGCDSRVAKTAYKLSQKRQAKSLPGTPEDDWKEAERIVQERFAREVIRRLA